MGVVQAEWRPIDQLVRNVSRLTRLSRLAADIIRWIRNVRIIPSLRHRESLSADKIRNGLWVLIRLAQEASYPTELEDLKKGIEVCSGSSLIKLSPFIDHRGL